MAMHDVASASAEVEGAEGAGIGQQPAVATIPPAAERSLIDETALIDPRATIGDGTRVWGLTQVREFAVIGADCTISRGVYVDHGVEVGAGSKVQNGAQLFAPAKIGEGVFIGPSAVLTNDLVPRAMSFDGEPKAAADWSAEGVNVGRGASIGASAVVVAGVRIGPWAMVGAGAVVADHVPAHALVVGVPARQIGWVSEAGERLRQDGPEFVDDATGTRYAFAVDGLVLVQ